MFRKHAVQMKIVKDAEANIDSTDSYLDKLEATAEEADQLIQTAVRAAVTVIVAKTASEVVLHIVKTLV